MSWILQTGNKWNQWSLGTIGRKQIFASEEQVDFNNFEEHSVRTWTVALTNYGKLFAKTVSTVEEYLVNDDEVIGFPELTEDTILEVIQIAR